MRGTVPPVEPPHAASVGDDRPAEAGGAAAPSGDQPIDAPPRQDMVRIPAREFTMGSDRHYPEEAPAHRVAVAGFLIDRYAVTNAEFARFVAATGHVTMAEQTPDAADYPGSDPEMLVAGSSVFVDPGGPVDLSDPYNWWRYVTGADWRHPQGTDNTVEGRDEHPVVHVAWSDVEAYASWAGKEVPTEAEWELAARGGLDGADFAWGNAFNPGGRYMANTWQGRFPHENQELDGFAGTAPVGSFPPNGYGLYDMIGNVWEWTVDWYRDHAAAEPSCCAPRDPRGARRDESVGPTQAHPGIPRKVVKGGSHLCAPNYCRRYRPAARMAQPIDTSTSHLGFRLVRRGDAVAPDD